MTDAPADVETMRFDDHTVRRIENRAQFESLATRDHGITTTKLTITSFFDAARRDLVFYDSHFYTLHDEWYWFRLLNGAAVPGDDTAPVTGLTLPTVQAAYEWARAQTGPLPLDLQFGGDRLYSWRFYDLAFGRMRTRGCATMLRTDARTGASPAPERWAFELEYPDELTYPELVVFFQTIESRLGPELARELKFLVRSAAQENLAQQMEREQVRRVAREDRRVARG